MSSSESPKSKFEFEGTWERIEITGFKEHEQKKAEIVYFLQTAVNLRSDLLIEDDKITIKDNSVNNRSLLLEVTLERLLARFDFLEVVSF